MGECGCYTGVEFAKFPGPDNSWYVIDIHTGCAGCDMSGGGISIRHVKVLEDYEDDIPDLPFTELYEGCLHFSIELPTTGRHILDLAKSVMEDINEKHYNEEVNRLLSKAAKERDLAWTEKSVKGQLD